MERLDRREWLRQLRRSAEARFDTLYAPTYDATDAPMTDTHRRFVERVVDACPPRGSVLDVPCGTGKYFGIVLGAGRSVVGIDRSQGMLDQARAKQRAVRLEKGALQDLAFEAAFDGVISVDAMENVPPEDWPLVLANLARAVRPDGLVYLTVEEVDEREIDEGYEAAVGEGLPVVRGEHAKRGGGYHHYPSRAQVHAWIAEQGLEVVESDTSPGDGYRYYHLLLQTSPSPAG